MGFLAGIVFMSAFVGSMTYKVPYQSLPTPDLYYSFNEADADKLPGVPVQADIFGAPLFEQGVLGPGLHFNKDGTTDIDYINLGNHRDKCFGNLNHCDNGLTMAFWLKLPRLPQTSTETFYVMTSGAHSTGSHGVFYGFSSLNARAWFMTSASWYRMKHSVSNYQVGVWHHITFTFSLTDGPALYMNGTQTAVTMATAAGSGTSTYNDFIIGLNALPALSEGSSEEDVFAARVYRRRIHPMEEFGCLPFRRRYRVTKAIALSLVDDLTNHIDVIGDGQGNAVSIEDRLCLALRYFATGSNYSLVADYQGVSIPTVSRSVAQVSDYFYENAYKYILWPELEEEKERIATEFMQEYGQPRVLGCVDGSHISIRKPRDNEAAYVNRKGFHSINVMFVGDSRMQITHIDPRFPGSVHDGYVWNASAIRAAADDHQLDPYFLLGDSGYGCKPNLFTPIDEPANLADLDYNDWQRTTRSIIERLIGHFKQRWRVTDNHGGYMFHTPARCARIIIACACLHNLCERASLPVEFDNDVDGYAVLDPHFIEADEDDHEDGDEMPERRALYVTNHF